MKCIFTLSLIVMFFLGCSTTRLVDQWKSPDNPVFEANKILVVGMTPNVNSRRIFEEELASVIEENGNSIAVRSVDFFEHSFTTSKKTEIELNDIEDQLLQADFDAIILSKVVGSENKTSLIKAINNLNQNFSNFRDDYYINQELYYDSDEVQTSTIYHTETALYCICPGKERELIWRGSVDLINPQKTERSIRDYVKLIASTFEDQQLILIDY
jgi:hypothetical protein